LIGDSPAHAGRNSGLQMSSEHRYHLANFCAAPVRDCLQ
jgi:hypothetical protein